MTTAAGDPLPRDHDVVIDSVGDEMIATLFSGVGQTKASDAGRAYVLQDLSGVPAWPPHSG